MKAALIRVVTSVRTTRQRLPITTLGAAVLALTVAAWVLAAQFGWRESEIIAATGLFLVVAGLPFLFSRGTFSATLTAAPDRVVVGEVSLGTVTIRNGGSVRSLPQRVELTLGTAVARFEVPSIAGGDHVEQAFVVPTDRRSIVEVGPVSMVRGDPLGLYRRDSAYAEPMRIFVHPRSVYLPPLSSGWVRDVDGPTFDNSPRGDVAFHTIREYVPGDDLRHVHWKSTARTGTMMVRQYVDNRRPQLVLILDEFMGAYGSADEFERAIEIIASVELACLREGQEFSHHRGTRRVPGSRASTVLDDLSAATLNQRDTLPLVANRLGMYDAGATVAVLVTGSTASAGTVQRVSRQLERSMRTVNVRVTPRRSAVRESAMGVEMVVDSVKDFARYWIGVCAR